MGRRTIINNGSTLLEAGLRVQGDLRRALAPIGVTSRAIRALRARYCILMRLNSYQPSWWMDGRIKHVSPPKWGASYSKLLLEDLSVSSERWSRCCGRKGRQKPPFVWKNCGMNSQPCTSSRFCALIQPRAFQIRTTSLFIKCAVRTRMCKPLRDQISLPPDPLTLLPFYAKVSRVASMPASNSFAHIRISARSSSVNCSPRARTLWTLSFSVIRSRTSLRIACIGPPIRKSSCWYLCCSHPHHLTPTALACVGRRG